MKSEPFESSLVGIHSLTVPKQIADSLLAQGRSRVRVRVSFEGKSVEYYAALQKRQGNHYVMLNKANQKKLGVYPNDFFLVELLEDTSKYGADMPEEFEAVLTSDYDAYQIFEGLTDGKKRGIIYTIARCKNSQTRIDKSLLICENLKRGIRDGKELLKQF